MNRSLPVRQANGDSPGLTEAEAQRRLEQYGPNEIPERRSHPLLTLARKFWGPIPWMLEATILLQVLLGRGGEAAIIAMLLSGDQLCRGRSCGQGARAFATSADSNGSRASWRDLALYALSRPGSRRRRPSAHGRSLASGCPS